MGEKWDGPDFERCLAGQLEGHPAMAPRDVAKLCYQAAHGAEHLLADRERARAWLVGELEETEAGDGPLWEQISPEVCRVNLAPWKKAGLPAEWLWRMFAASCTVSEAGDERMEEYLQKAGAVIGRGVAGFGLAEWEAFLAEYRRQGMPAVHHSEGYRLREKPAYRMVRRSLCRLLPILERVRGCTAEGRPPVIAIDGRAAGGKSTLAADLQAVLGGEVIHMDDFFLPPDLRTEARLEEAGGNIHYERFAREVLPGLAEGVPFSHGVFDCSKMALEGVREIGADGPRIVEGSYSCHPYFGDYADVTVFVHVDPREQLDRIARRNGADWLPLFRDRWIPMEEAYFARCAIRERADVTV